MRRSKALQVAAQITAFALLVAGCSGSLRTVTQPDRLAINRAAAVATAHEMIAQVLLPAGAVRVAHEPAGDHRLLAPNRQIDPDLAHVSLTAWWTLRRNASTVLRYVGNHPDPGSIQRWSGDIQMSRPRAASHWLGSYWPSPGQGIASRRLQVTVTRLADGRAGVMASVDVQWVVPRPVREVVPAGVRRIVLTLVRPGRGDRQGSVAKVVLNDSHKVRRVIRLVDSLPAEQPIRLPCAELEVTFRCPADPEGPGSLSVSFSARPGGPVLARARVGIPVGWAYTGVVGDPIRFSLHGRVAAPLSGPKFVSRMLTLFGLHAG